MDAEPKRQMSGPKIENQEKFKFVIGTNRKLEIGKIYNSLTDQHVILRPGHPYKVVAESNLSEWVKCVESLGGKVYEEHIELPCDYYYEIQTD